VTELSNNAELLLEISSRYERGVAMPVASKALGLSTEALKEVVRELTSRGLLESVDPFKMHAPLRIRAAGRELLNRMGGGVPVSTLTLSLASGHDDDVESLRVVLRDGEKALAEDEVFESSYTLSAIRYLLVFEPGSLSANTTTAAALRIGSALLPCRPGCVNNGKHERAECVRGVFEEVLDAASASLGWVRVELLIEPPWTYVPWEMAALDLSSRLVLDRRLSISRLVGDDPARDASEGPVDVLLLTPAVDDEEQRKVLLREAKTISEAIDRCPAARRPLSADIATDFTDAGDMARRIERAKPTLVHVLGHGSDVGLDTAVATIGRAEAANALAQPGVKSVILSSCFGATSFGTNRAGSSLAWSVANCGVPWVVAFEGSAEATHSVNFATAFYPALGVSGSIERAVQAGRANMGRGSAYEQFGQVVLFNR
jgi:hypothetical protein